jgi:hypothetical protein
VWLILMPAITRLLLDSRKETPAFILCEH